MTLKKRWAYFGHPHTGGTYSVFKSLRSGLAPHGIDVIWLGIGPKALAASLETEYANDNKYGLVVAGNITDEREQAEALCQYLESSDIDGIFINVLANRVQTNIARYLKPSIKRIMIVHSITRGTYAAARSIRDYVHATVCVSPRIRDDLVLTKGFPSTDTFVIPNAIDVNAFSGSKRKRHQEPLKILSLGRIIDTDKGIFWLPEIIEKLSETNISLTIAGDGTDLGELKKRCAKLGNRVMFAGKVPHSKVPALMAEHDIYLFTSRFEGLGISLVEAMASGCVPISSRIRKVTEFVVTDSIDGFLFEIGNTEQAAKVINKLANDRQLLFSMSQSAQKNALERFSLEAMSSKYADVINGTEMLSVVTKEPQDIKSWKIPGGLQPGISQYIPEGIKKHLRIIREKTLA